MVNFGPLAAEIGSLVWGTPANFNSFRILAALLHVTLVVGVSQTLRRWTEGATYIRQGGHHVGIGPHSSLFIVLLYNTAPELWPGGVMVKALACDGEVASSTPGRFAVG